jgi:hypothetical protein
LAAEGALEAGGAVKSKDLQLAEEAPELAPLSAVRSRGVNVEAPCDGVGVLDKEVDTVDDDGGEEDLPRLVGCDGPVGGAVGVHKFPDFAVVPEGGADKVARSVRAVVGVGEGEAGKHA